MHPNVDLVLCTCALAVTVEGGGNGGRMRQMCPYCGSFYSSAANSDARLRRARDIRVELPHIVSTERRLFS